ncbi:MAG: RIP metalloprotease RseP [Myxococcota bacterium]
MTVLSYVFAFVLLLGVLIFIHELGHFAVAKLCGVRVLKFSLGFGAPVGIGRHRLSRTIGHTEYVVGWIPLGGFVKMLGENPDEADDPSARAHPSETLGAKPLWQKLAVVFAGPAMNLLFPVAVFTGTLFVGLLRPDAVIGTVEVASPAAQAQLRPGDRIAALDGASVRWWEDVEEAVRSRPGERLTLSYERDGEAATLELVAGTRSGFDEFGEVQPVGWVGLGHGRPRAMLGIPDAAAAAAVAGLRSGDLVRAVAGEAVEDWHELAAAYAAADPAAAVEFDVERGPQDSPERLAVTVAALGDLAALGVVPANVLVSSVSPDSPAARGGLEAGDLILSVDGRPVGSFASFAETVRTSGGRALDLVLARAGESRRVAIAPELTETDVGLGIKEPRYLVGITAEAATLPGSTVMDRERNPLIAIPRAVAMTVEITHTFLRGLGKLITGEVSRRQLAGPIGIAEIAGNAFQRGWETYLSIMVLISINLGILNLLPIPILDGGQALLFIVEGLKGSALSLRTRAFVQQIGLTVLLLLMGMAFWNDLSRHWSKIVDWLRSGTGL